MCRLFCFIALLYFTSHANDQFLGRSGDIIIQNTDQPEAQFSWNIEQKVIQESQIYNMFARLFGVPRIYSQSEVNVFFDPFSKPSGNLLFSIDGLTSRQLPSVETKILGKKPITNVISTSSTPFSVLATAVSGLDVASHGVVNKKWPGHNIHDVYNERNLFDNLLQLHGDKLLAISASSSVEAAATLAPNKAYVSDKQSILYHWNAENGQYNSFPTNNFLSLSRSQFDALFKTLATLANFKISYSEETAVVTIQAYETTFSFDLTDEVDEIIFAELLFVLKVSQLPQMDKNMLFSFHFQSLRLIVGKYGENSPTFKLIANLIDAVIAETIKAFPDYSYAILFFPFSQANEQIESTIASTVAPYLNLPLAEAKATVRSYYPHIYLPSSVDKIAVCDKIKETLTTLPTNVPSVVCPFREKVSKKREVAQATNPTYDDPIKTFHVVVWMSVALISILITALAYLFTMDTGEDTLLFYRTSNMALNASKPGKSKHVKV